MQCHKAKDFKKEGASCVAESEQHTVMILDELFGSKIKVYAFVGPSGTGKSYRAQMVASEKSINYIIDDGLLIKDNEVLAGESAKKGTYKSRNS